MYYHIYCLLLSGLHALALNLDLELETILILFSLIILYSMRCEKNESEDKKNEGNGLLCAIDREKIEF